LIDHVTTACLIGYHQVSSSVEHSHYLFIYFERLITERFFFCCWCFCWPGQPMIGPMRRRAPACPEPMPSLVHHRVHFCVLIDSHTVALLDASHCLIQLTFVALKSISHVLVLSLIINSRIWSDIFKQNCIYWLSKHSNNRWHRV